MLSTVCMGVVVLTRWLWMQPRGSPHLSPPLQHPPYLPHPLAPLLLLLQDTLSTLLLPPCPSPSATGLTLSPLPGGLLPHLAWVTEDLVHLDSLLALQGPLFLPIHQFLCHHPALSPSPWAQLGLATNPPLHQLQWCPLLPDQIPDKLPLLPGSHRLGISSSICMSVCGAHASKHTKTITICEQSNLKLGDNSKSELNI